MRLRTPLPTVHDLVAQLPGEPVALDALLAIAAREGLAGRMAAAELRRADGDLLASNRITDPMMEVVSGVASDLYGGSQRRALSSSAVATAGLPWGTDVNVTYARQDGSGLNPVLQLTAPSTFELGVSQPLLRGRDTRSANWRAASRERSASEYSRQRTWQEVATDIELRYWALAEAQSVEAVRQRSLELSERMLARNQELAALQLMADADVLTVRSGVALRRSALVQARQERIERSDALVFAAYGMRASARLGAGDVLLKAIDTRTDSAAQPAPRELQPDGQRLPLADPQDPAAALSVALSRRADVLAVRDRRDAAEVRATLARNSLRPNVSLEGGWASLANPLRLTGSTAGAGTISGWRAGVSVSAPLLNRADRGRALAAAADRELEELRVQAVENGVRQEVRTTLRALQLTRERRAIADEAAQLAGHQLDAERKRLELGLGDTFRLLQTEEYAVQAELEAVRTRYDVRRAEGRYRLAVGVVVSAGR
jgi:outer membrane protein TolC